MPLLAAHEYKVNRGTRSISIVRENPTLRWHVSQLLRVGTAADGTPLYDDNPAYHPPIVYQDGKFYYEDGQELSKSQIPAYILDHLRENPPPKPTTFGERQIRMTMEEAERAFSAGSDLDRRVQARRETDEVEEPENVEPRSIRRKIPKRRRR